jgi:hypothetical protein
MEKDKNKILLVFYIDTRVIDPDEIPKLMSKLGEKLKPEFNAESIFIPIQGESRVECINPKYITDSQLIKEHERLMAELHEHLNNQLNE